MVLNLILASICIEKNWGDEKILVIPVTWQISAQPLKHVNQVEHEGNLEAAGDGFESDKEFVAQMGRVVDPVPREEKAKDGAKKGDEKEERTKKPDEAKSCKDLPPLRWRRGARC